MVAGDTAQRHQLRDVPGDTPALLGLPSARRRMTWTLRTVLGAAGACFFA